MKTTRLEKWYAIAAHAKAIAEYAEDQTAHGTTKTNNSADRVAARAERISNLAHMIVVGDEE